MKIRKFVLLIVMMFAMDKVFAYDFEVDGIYYDVVSLSEQTCKVVKRSSVYKYSGDIVIPAHVNHANKTLTVVEISEKLFYGCSGLTGITIPNTVASISNDMFNGCTKLKRVVIEDGRNVLRLGYNSYLFDDGDGYYSENLFCDCPITSLYIGRNISFDNESTFNDNNTIVELTIGNLVTEISGWMFCGCGSLKSVTIPNSVTEIDWFAFCCCTGLTEIVIPNSVTDIGDSAFSGCSGLKKLTIPNSVKSIGENAFGGCCGLTSLIIPNSITEIEYYTFGECSGLTNIVIPNTVTKIGGYAFYGCI